MNSTQAKILANMASNLEAGHDVEHAAHLTFMWVRDEMTRLGGQKFGNACADLAADFIAESIVNCIAANHTN